MAISPYQRWWMEERKRVVPGAKIRMTSPSKNRLWHVLAVVDDEYIVLKWWYRRGNRWVYEVKWAYDFYLAPTSLVTDIEIELIPAK